MTLRWVVLRPIKEPCRVYAGMAVPSTAQKITVVGAVEAEDRLQAAIKAAEVYGPRLEVVSELAYRQQRAEETRLKARNRTRYIELTDAPSLRRHA